MCVLPVCEPVCAEGHKGGGGGGKCVGQYKIYNRKGGNVKMCSLCKTECERGSGRLCSAAYLLNKLISQTVETKAPGRVQGS